MLFPAPAKDKAESEQISEFKFLGNWVPGVGRLEKNPSRSCDLLTCHVLVFMTMETSPSLWCNKVQRPRFRK